MMPNILHPYTASIGMAIAVCGVVVFTIAQVIATVPIAILHAGSAEAAHAVTQEHYAGVVAWVSSRSLRITDSLGISRVFTIDESTQILKDSTAKAALLYSDIRILDHARVTTLKDGNHEVARVIEVH